MLIPSPGASLSFGDPILVGASYLVTPFLYDPSGNLVDLRLLKHGGTLMPCAGDYFLYQPSTATYGTTGEFTMLLGDDMLPSAVSSYTMISGGGSPETTVSAEINLSRLQIEPFESSSGMCAPTILAGTTVDGLVEYTVSISPAAPIFVEAWYDDQALGRIQNFGSTVPIVTKEASPDVNAEVRIELPHVQGSGDCVEARLYTWTFLTVWSQRICFANSESLSFNVQFGMRAWNLRDTATVAPPYPHHTTSGCAMGPQRDQGGIWLFYVLGLALLRRRTGCASCSAVGRESSSRGPRR